MQDEVDEIRFGSLVRPSLETIERLRQIFDRADTSTVETGQEPR